MGYLFWMGKRLILLPGNLVDAGLMRAKAKLRLSRTPMQRPRFPLDKGGMVISESDG